MDDRCIWIEGYVEDTDDSYYVDYVDDTCQTVGNNCFIMYENLCKEYGTLSNNCFWDDKMDNCLPIYRPCNKNNKEACIHAEECQWGNTGCIEVAGYRDECSNSINDIGYSGTQNVTCDSMPCLNWELVFKRLHMTPSYSEYDSVSMANNYCRQSYVSKYEFHPMVSWCYVEIITSTGIDIARKPCCVPLCDNKDNVRSKCVFTERGRYEYAGNMNVSCQGNDCITLPQIIDYAADAFVQKENITQVDLPLNKLDHDSSQTCTYRTFYHFFHTDMSASHFSCYNNINVCRNPTLQNEGDFCYGKDDEYGGFLSRQKCCVAQCEDDDQVTCTWSINGTEYSGKIDVTSEGIKCVNWSRSLHKNDAFMMDYLENSGGNSKRWYKYDILSLFPDHSLDEAANYCRNPTRDSCGPWCYTSYADNSTGYCNVPECDYANKGGKQEAVKGCESDTVISVQYYLRYVIHPTLLIIGLILNLYAYNVFQQNNLKSSTTSFMFRILSVFDSLALVWVLVRMHSSIFLTSLAFKTCITLYVKLTGQSDISVGRILDGYWYL